MAGQRDDPDSTLSRVRRLLRLRTTEPELRTGAGTEVLFAGYPLVYRRGDRHLVVVNPAGTARSVELPALALASAQPLEVSGVRLLDGHVEAGPFGYGVFLMGTGATTAGCAKV